MFFVIKKMISIFLFGVLLLIAGCSSEDKSLDETASIIPANASISLDGMLAVYPYIQEDLEDEDGLLYSIYDVQLYDNLKKSMICTYHIPGNDFHFLWSPNSKYITAAYSGRTWSNFSILDVRTHAAVSMPGISEVLDHFKTEGEKIDCEMNANRPDPSVAPIEWSPDSTRILVSYQFKDIENKTQNGVFIFDFLNGTYSDLQQFTPSEYDHVALSKPENFSWN